MDITSIPNRSSDAGPEHQITGRASYLYLLDDAEDFVKSARVFCDSLAEERLRRFNAIDSAIAILQAAREVA